MSRILKHALVYLMAAAVLDYLFPSYERMRDTLIPNLYEEVTKKVKKRLASSPTFWL